MRNRQLYRLVYDAYNLVKYFGSYGQKCAKLSTGYQNYNYGLSGDYLKVIQGLYIRYLVICRLFLGYL